MHPSLENYFDPATKKWTSKNTGSATFKHGFVQFCYEPIKQIINTCMNDQKDKLWPMLTRIGVTMKSDEKELMGKALMKRVMQTWLPASIWPRGYTIYKKKNLKKTTLTARILVEFLEVAITSIVFLKGIYPPGAFERRKYMNLVVHSACHPELRDYIHSAVSGLHPFIQKGLVERVAVIFFNSDSIPVERFMFKLTVNPSYGSRVEEADLEFSLRSFFIKLPFSESLTRVLPQDCRREITAYFRSLPQACTSKDAELWIPTDTQQWQQPPLITPIKSMSGEPLSVQLYWNIQVYLNQRLKGN
ncbi:unnamed protein product [Prunus brigantina]